MGNGLAGMFLNHQLGGRQQVLGLGQASGGFDTTYASQAQAQAMLGASWVSLPSPEQIKRQQELEAQRLAYEKAKEDPQWWKDRDEIPPLEPTERFLAWLDLELRDVRMKLLGLA